MADISPKEVFDVLLESLKKQAEEYKLLISQDNLTHDQRKDYDSEIKQMFELLSQMTNSTIVLSSTEIESLKVEFQTKLQELQTILDNPNITTVKGADGKDGTNGIDGQNGIDGKDFTFDMFTPEQLVLLKGEKGQDGTNGINGQNGIDGKDFTFDMFTPEQLASLKGADGQSLTFDMLTSEQKASLKGADGQSFTFDMFTPEQLQQIANLVNITPFDSTSILDRLIAIETALSIVPPIPEPNYFYAKPFVTDIVHNYDTSPYTMTISAGYYESEMIDLVESQYINHVIKTNWNVLNWNTNPITVDINCVVSDGLLENPLEGNCVVCNFKFERAFDGVLRVSGGSYYMGEYGEFPPQMATDFVWVERENDLLKISLHTDPMGIIKDIFYEMFGTDKLFYKFDIIASSVAPLVLAETPITETVERWSLQ